MKKSSLKPKTQYSDLIIILFWAAFLFTYIFIVDRNNLDEETLSVFIIPYVNLNVTVVMAVITFFVVVALVCLDKLRFDGDMYIFFARIIFYFVPVLYISGDFEYGTAFSMILTMLSYYIGLNYRGSIKLIINILIAASIFVCLQLIFILVVRHLSVFDMDDLKYYMRLPMGRTNYVGVFLIACYVMVDNLYASRKSILKYLYFTLLIFCLLSAGTRSGILVLCGYFIFKFCRYVHAIRYKRFSIKKIIIFASACVLVVCAGGVLFIAKGEEISRMFSYDSMVKSRLRVYAEALGYFFKNPLLGRSAYVYHVYDSVDSHNFLLESLVQTGVIGTVLFFMTVISAYRQICRIKNDNVRRMLKVFIIITFIHGSVEPNLFTIKSDVFFWFIAGAGVGYSHMKLAASRKKIHWRYSALGRKCA